ncbi:MAG: CxxxxCH/CxxCH domain-containing protein [Deltaproteobacteria bacterium]|nr:CxxxxCH/CxxCH domain-containing protein [Deltaproteobacteria bacterium]
MLIAATLRPAMLCLATTTAICGLLLFLGCEGGGHRSDAEINDDDPDSETTGDSAVPADGRDARDAREASDRGDGPTWDGALDFGDGAAPDLLCSACHGDDSSAAPPRSLDGETATSSRAVGAHRRHLAESDWHRVVTCDECHVVPDGMFQAGHIDSALPAELAWGGTARAGGAEPEFDGARCADAWCHGARLSAGGGTITEPVWTHVDGTPAACGACHGLPPGGDHPAAASCELCHGEVAGPGFTFREPSRHIDGIVDVVGGGCDACHGGGGEPAPPLDLAGNTATTFRGVGAHRSHLAAGSTWHRAGTCTDCHLVPAAVDAAGHLDTPTPAEVTWSSLAATDGATPAFDGVACSGSYCHGATLDGGTLTAPRWTTVDGSQAACGTCHGLPPEGDHPVSTNCDMCHGEVIGPRFAFREPARHIDGRLDVTTACDSCHGGGGEPAPPVDLAGNAATTFRGVGAHRSHLAAGSTWRRDVACGDCHRVPATLDAAGHVDTPRPAELTWSVVASAGGASPAFDGSTCSDSWCHGARLDDGGGTATAPAWTRVDGTQGACGACHGLPPGGSHTTLDRCELCHGDVIGPGRVFRDRSRHVDGVVDVATGGCDSCHGGGGVSAPPVDVSGNGATTFRGVGAHRSHLATGSTWRRDVVCSDCHRVPPVTDTAGHLDTPLPAELTWSAVASAGGASPAFDGSTCSDSWCHGARLDDGGGTATAPAWTRVDGTQAACGACHGLPPGGSHTTLDRCELCHGDVIGPGFAFRNRSRHIDGVIDVATGGCDSCHGGGGVAAPPVDLSGGSATSSRGVGAHRSHLLSSPSWHRAVDCSDCHRVPAAMDSAGHLDSPLPAELAWSALASAGGAIPGFDGTRCSGGYCHGATLGGGTLTAPRWTTVDGSQAACGTCHGLPPGGSHPAYARCEMCHGDVIGPGMTFRDPTRHIDGVIDAAGGACDACHGAPPTAGSHLRHFNSGVANASYGGLQTAASAGAPAEYGFGCGTCHGRDPAQHMDGGVDVVLYDPAAPAGSLLALNPATARYTPGSTVLYDTDGIPYSEGTCTDMYCHSSGQASAAVRTYSAGARWGGALSGSRCAECHGDPPTYPSGGGGTPGANSHYDVTGFGTGWGPGGHVLGIHWTHDGSTAAADTSTVINCNICHYTTTTREADTTFVDPTPGGATCAGASCHTATTNPPAGSPGVVTNTGTHVNGTADIAFSPLPFRTTASLSFVPPGWTRYPAFDETVLSTYSGWNPSTKTCTSVPCHVDQTSVRWGAVVPEADYCACHVIH